MTRWLDRVLVRLHDVVSGIAIVLDPDMVVPAGALGGEVVTVQDWWGLRASYERAGRRRSPQAARLVLHVKGDLATEPLPWDIEQAAVAVVPVRLPGPPPVRAALAELDGEEAERAIAAVQAAAVDPAAAVLAVVAGVPVPSTSLLPADQLRIAARLALRSGQSAALAKLAHLFVIDLIVVGLLADPPDTTALQREWEAFARGDPTAWASVFEAARFELGQLFATGLLKPVARTSDFPSWASVGLRDLSEEERAQALLKDLPVPWPPADHAGWCIAAEWWGDVRRLVARAPDELRKHAWIRWDELDCAFQPWLRERYGAVLSSAARWPPALHRVAHHLARRLHQGDADRILLIVVDGLGHAQWLHLRDRLSLRVADAGSTFAMVPTYTTVSRQAIFAGDLPISFADSLWTTHLERRRWMAFWADQGIGITGVAYHRVKGRFPHDAIDFGAARAVGVVVNAVDDLMHTSELFGDAQLLANLDVWAANGFLDDLLQRATAAGFETWITSDHGNLECAPAGTPSEGIVIEAQGKRLLRYPNRILRDASKVDGIVWDDIPGLPPSAEWLRFAPRRLAYTNNAISISHGGLSLDEVIVPLVRVKP